MVTNFWQLKTAVLILFLGSSYALENYRHCDRDLCYEQRFHFRDRDLSSASLNWNPSIREKDLNEQRTRVTINIREDFSIAKLNQDRLYGDFRQLDERRSTLQRTEHQENRAISERIESRRDISRRVNEREVFGVVEDRLDSERHQRQVDRKDTAERDSRQNSVDTREDRERFQRLADIENRRTNSPRVDVRAENRDISRGVDARENRRDVSERFEVRAETRDSSLRIDARENRKDPSHELDPNDRRVTSQYDHKYENRRIVPERRDEREDRRETIHRIDVRDNRRVISARIDNREDRKDSTLSRDRREDRRVLFERLEREDYNEPTYQRHQRETGKDISLRINNLQSRENMIRRIDKPENQENERDISRRMESRRDNSADFKRREYQPESYERLDDLAERRDTLRRVENRDIFARRDNGNRKLQQSDDEESRRDRSRFALEARREREEVMQFNKQENRRDVLKRVEIRQDFGRIDGTEFRDVAERDRREDLMQESRRIVSQRTNNALSRKYQLQHMRSQINRDATSDANRRIKGQITMRQVITPEDRRENREHRDSFRRTEDRLVSETRDISRRFDNTEERKETSRVNSRENRREEDELVKYNEGRNSYRDASRRVENRETADGTREYNRDIAVEKARSRPEDRETFRRIEANGDRLDDSRRANLQRERHDVSRRIDRQEVEIAERTMRQDMSSRIEDREVNRRLDNRGDRLDVSRQVDNREDRQLRYMENRRPTTQQDRERQDRREMPKNWSESDYFGKSTFCLKHNYLYVGQAALLIFVITKTLSGNNNDKKTGFPRTLNEAVKMIGY